MLCSLRKFVFRCYISFQNSPLRHWVYRARSDLATAVLAGSRLVFLCSSLTRDVQSHPHKVKQLPHLLLFYQKRVSKTQSRST